MNPSEKLKESIVKLVKAHLILSDNSIEIEGKVFDEYFQLRKEVLESFGLPNSDKYGKLLFITHEPNEIEIETMVKEFNNAATEYLLAPIKSDLKYLEEGVLLNLEADEILSELGINRHIYTNFVYNEILIKGVDTPISVLEALRIANTPKILNILGIIALSQDFSEKESRMLEFLKLKKVKFLDKYLSVFQPNVINVERSGNRLAEFWTYLNGKHEFESLTQKFDAIANCLMNYLTLTVGENSYRIVETEIYYNDGKTHSDPYVHLAQEQGGVGNWYFNGFGLDVTFGDKEKGIYAGILIRGIKRIGENNQYISGPSNVLKEIFSNIGNVVSNNKNISLQEMNKKILNETIPMKSTRIGLTKKASDKENYLEKYYRYLVELNFDHKFKDKEKVVKHLVESNHITREEANKEILKYNLFK